MPVSFGLIFRLGIFLLLGLHAFVCYSIARALAGTVGVQLWTMLVAGLFALAMMMPLMWAAGLIELPEAIAAWRAERRWSGGQCPVCGYPLAIIRRDDRCSECAAALREPKDHSFSWSTLRRFVAMVLFAWALGVVLGESWGLADESRFRQEAAARSAAGEAGAYTRNRWWPGTWTELTTTGDGKIAVVE